MGNAERLALVLAEAAPEHHAAFVAAIVRERLRACAVAHHHGGHRIGALLRLGDVEGDRLPLGPGADRAARRLARAGGGARTRSRAPRRRSCRARRAGRTADAPAACRNISGSAARRRGRSSPSRARACRLSGAPRAHAGLRRRNRGPAASSAPSANPPSRRRRPRRPSRTACSRARRPTSTSSSASCPAARIALPIAAMSFCTPDAVSTCATRIGLDLAGVGLEPRLDRLGPHRAAMSPASTSTSRAEHLRGLAPGDREAPAFQHQHLVAAREHVGQRRLPGAVAVRRVDVGAPRGAEDLAHVGEQPVGERDQRPRIDVDRRLLHGGEHRIRDDGRTGDGEELTAGRRRTWRSLCGDVIRRLPSMFCRAVRSINLNDGSSGLRGEGPAYPFRPVKRVGANCGRRRGIPFTPPAYPRETRGVPHDADRDGCRILPRPCRARRPADRRHLVAAATSQVQPRRRPAGHRQGAGLRQTSTRAGSKASCPSTA